MNTYQDNIHETEFQDHAVAVLIISPKGIPLVRDPEKSLPFWKLPGGRSNTGETAEACAIREVCEEIGLDISENNLVVIHQEDRGNHGLTIFRTDLTALPVLSTLGNDGEEVHVFTVKEVLDMQNLFPNHRKIIENILRSL